MNKAEIIHRLQALPYSPEEYWLLDRSGLVLRGLAKGAGSIRLGCTTEMADQLAAEGFERRDDQAPGYSRIFRISREILVHENLLYGGFDLIDGYMVITPEGQQSMDWNLAKRMGFDPDKMKETGTEHFVFHYPEGSLAEKDIHAIAAKREKAWQAVCECLQAEPDYPAQVYFCDSIQKTNEKYRDRMNGLFIFPDIIVEVYNEKVKVSCLHELTHMISTLAGNPESRAVREGIAVCFDGTWEGIDITAWAKWFLDTGQIRHIQDLLANDEFNQRRFWSAYPLAGAVTAWLIITFGMEKYLAFYKYRDSTEGMRIVYGQAPNELDGMFLEYLKAYSMPDPEKIKLEKRLHTLGMNLDGSSTREYIAVV